MKPLTIARLYCANFNADESCLGAQIADDLSTKHCTPRPHCLLAVPGQRCNYFESIFLRSTLDNIAGVHTPNEHEEYTKGIRAYRMAANVPSSNAEDLTKRLCPDCKTNLLDTGRRLCDPCKKLHRSASFKAANSK